MGNLLIRMIAPEDFENKRKYTQDEIEENHELKNEPIFEVAFIVKNTDGGPISNAVVGVTKTQEVILTVVNMFSSLRIKPFDNIDDAKDWLID